MRTYEIPNLEGVPPAQLLEILGLLRKEPTRAAFTFQQAAEICRKDLAWLYARKRVGNLNYVPVSGRRLVILAEDLAGDTLEDAFKEWDTLKIGQVARSLGVSKRTVLRMVRQEGLPATQDRRNCSILVKSEDLVEFLRRRRVSVRSEQTQCV